METQFESGSRSIERLRIELSGLTPFRILASFLVALMVSPMSGHAAEGVSNQATAEAVVVNGFVVEIRLTSGGNGYFTPPPVTIIGTGTNAQAVASVQGGKVVGITVINA